MAFEPGSRPPSLSCHALAVAAACAEEGLLPPQQPRKRKNADFVEIFLLFLVRNSKETIGGRIRSSRERFPYYF